MNVEVITALYDIGRVSHDGRNMTDYLNWVYKTMQIENNMTIYTEEKYVDLLRSFKSTESLNIIVQPLEKIYYFKYFEKIQEIVSDGVFKTKIKDSNRLECTNPLYSIIIHNKFKWMKESIEKDVFKSDYFVWVDAGISRFFPDLDFNLKFSNFEKTTLDKITCQISSNFNYLEKIAYYDYIWDNNSFIAAGVIGGGKKILLDVDYEIEQIFEQYLSLGTINNEQISLGLLSKKSTFLFNFIQNLEGTPIPIFEKLFLKK